MRPTPFQRLLNEALAAAQADATSPFSHVAPLPGKAIDESELLALGSAVGHLAGANGRFTEAAAILRDCLAHPGLAPQSAVRRSLHRALAAVLICADRGVEAAAAAMEGIANPADECRLAALTGQMLAGRGRIGDAAPHLRKASTLVGTLPPGDETVQVCAGLATHLLKLGQQQAVAARVLVADAAALAVAAATRADVRTRHQVAYVAGGAALAAGDTTAALARVAEMLALDADPGITAYGRFHTISLACCAQHARGQIKVAQQALAAAREQAAQVAPAESAAIQARLGELEALFR